jgi:hypothetical protein
MGSTLAICCSQRRRSRATQTTVSTVLRALTRTVSVMRRNNRTTSDDALRGTGMAGRKRRLGDGERPCGGQPGSRLWR